MKRICLIGLLFISACAYFDTRSPQKRAEDLAKHYLDSALNGQGGYKIISFGKLDTVFNTDLKTGSTKKQAKTPIKGWSVYTIYEGNNAFGIFERHKVFVHIDTSFSRVTSIDEGTRTHH